MTAAPVHCGTRSQPVIAGNSAVNGDTAPDAEGPFSSAGFNLTSIDDQSTGFTGKTDQVGTGAAPINPHLGLMQNNGGPTDTMLLLFNSSAISRGFWFGVGTDQRGSPASRRRLQ